MLQANGGPATSMGTRRVGARDEYVPPPPPVGSSATDQLDPGQTPAEERTTRRGPTSDELLDGLNEPQRKAVVHAGHPLLVVAGAGSGKTRVLTRRIAWLVVERKAHPGSILAITFTNKAAAEMKERVEALVGKRARIMWVSTFHSACVRILRKEIHHFGYKSNFSIYDAADSKRLMTLVCRDLDLDPKQYQPNAILHWVSNHKNELRDHEEAAKDARNGLEEAYSSAYTLYQRRLREANALDFDDLIMTTVHLFQAHPDVCETYRRRFRHVLVDEYQDTNHAQYALVHQLCADDPEEIGERVEPAELMVVGDADQSIYAFRGASIRNILDFEQDFPDATTILLEQNYRSTQTILNAANAVIGHNQGRKPKRLWSQAGDGARIVGYVADDERDEARFVSEEIDKLTDTGSARPGEVAVFYRTNAQSRVFEEIFIRLGMPYKVVGGVRFYERREVRDALAYLRMLVNPADEISLRRVLNTPKRGIGDRAVECVQSLADRDRTTFWEALRRASDAPGLATRSLKAIEGFVGLVDELQSMVDAGERADVILESVLDRTGYLAELEASDDPQDGTRVENLAELVAVAREFSDDPVAGPSADPADVDARHARPGARRLPGAGGARRRHRPDPRHPRRAGRRGGHADDPPHRQGPGVPCGLPDRARGRRVPALPLSRRPARARGGAPPRVRRRHPRPAAALPLPGGRPLGVGRPGTQPGLTVPRRDADRPGRLAPHRGRPDPLGPARPGRRLGGTAGDADVGGAPQLLLRRAQGRRRGQGQDRPRDPVARAGRPGRPRLVRHGHRGGAGRSGREVRGVDRLRVRRRQAAAAAVRAGREALSQRRRFSVTGFRHAPSRPRKLGRGRCSTTNGLTR